MAIAEKARLNPYEALHSTLMTSVKNQVRDYLKRRRLKAERAQTIAIVARLSPEIRADIGLIGDAWIHHKT
ncbi:hypothetical protein [Rhizobium oryziradicis]|uniref:Uncharacterized protein n=1 Tax=Rhizobium oryziradicis TaxID=1867956 RepID=A0A1Q8ZNR4_9HYPH|nr:hypothetical protein [Rhizobium oryziradicis]OLP43540.1 hypothetical protein BJF95_22015 [Rhizobium oryziradicis]